MTLIEIMNEGAESYHNGASWSDAGDYPYGSAEEVAWKTGWEISCAEDIRSKNAPEHSMPTTSLLIIANFDKKWWVA